VHAVEFSRIGRTHDQAKTITQGNFTIIPDPHPESNPTAAAEAASVDPLKRIGIPRNVAPKR
jgi:hypothetical protein